MNGRSKVSADSGERGVVLLEGVVQNYAWGSTEALPRLRGFEPDGNPQAELWLGAHPAAPALVVRRGGARGLDEVIASDPVGQLGERVAAEFGGRLPFLLKILAAGEPLSLQAHPNRQQAEAGFGAEEGQGISADDPRRSFRDRNHKPELVCAVTPFSALCGFRPVVDCVKALRALQVAPVGPVIEALAADPDQRGLATALQLLLELPADEARPLVDQVVQSIRDGALHNDVERTAWTLRLGDKYPGDPGVVVSLLLNLVTLAPGQALFLGAGNLHCYLEGLAVEIMANSDNVLRGGLTVKHVDIDSLVAIVDSRPGDAPIQTPDGDCHTYSVPVSDFWFRRERVGRERLVASPGPEIVLCVEGRIEVAGESLSPGSACWVPASVDAYELGGEGTAFRAAVGSA